MRVAYQIKAKGDEKRKQTKEAIETFFSSLGSSLTAFVTDKQKVTTTVVGLTALAAGVYATREVTCHIEFLRLTLIDRLLTWLIVFAWLVVQGARVAGRFIERQLGTPSLVRETSKSKAHFSLVNTLRRIFTTQKGDGFSDVVLVNDMSTRVHQLAVSTRNTKSNSAPFRHIMFYGPPGQ